MVKWPRKVRVPSEGPCDLRMPSEGTNVLRTFDLYKKNLENQYINRIPNELDLRSYGLLDITFSSTTKVANISFCIMHKQM